jgi:hypothetical protein
MFITEKWHYLRAWDNSVRRFSGNTAAFSGRMLEHNESTKHYVVHCEVILHGGHDLTIIDTIIRAAGGLPIKSPSFN